MLSLKNLCLLKVSSLQLSCGEDDLPITVGDDLKKCFLFNGSFSGKEEYGYFDNDGYLHQGVNIQVLTIQYAGDGTWAFGFCHSCETCSGSTCDVNGHMKPVKVQFVLKEKETSESEAVFTTIGGLALLAKNHIYRVRWKNRNKQQVVSTVLTVQDGNVPGSSQLMLTTSTVFESGLVISSKLWVHSTLESSPVFKCSVGAEHLRTREIPLFLTEGEATAMEAFRDSFTECGDIDRDGNLTDDEEVESDGDLTDGEEDESDGDLTDDEEEIDGDLNEGEEE
eukprot:GFUD01020880.1.p1 GENE.GFUD01020880.1~~GFUD01020880.1.p1  ORF type:complete len:281 (-),score=74.24 GFUD01020880.1:185-1027(-)